MSGVCLSSPWKISPRRCTAHLFIPVQHSYRHIKKKMKRQKKGLNMKPKTGSIIWESSCFRIPVEASQIWNKTWLEADEQRLFCSVGVVESRSRKYQSTTEQPRVPRIWGWKHMQRSRRVSGRAQKSPSSMIPGRDALLRLFAGWLENGVWKKGRWSAHLEGEAAGESAATARLAGEGVAAC